MYTVITCPDCQYVQIVKDSPETTTCGRCRKRLNFRELKHYYVTEDKQEARDARSALTAKEQGYSEEFEELYQSEVFETASNVTDRVEDEVLESQGFTTKQLEKETSTSSTTKSRKEIIEDALVYEVDTPTREAVIDYATEHGVPPEKAGELIDKLQRQGLIIETGATLRLV